MIVATTDARLVALDARNGKHVWDDGDRGSHARGTRTPADRSSRAARSFRGCRAAAAIGPDRCFISAYDADDRQAAVEVQHHRARRRAGRRYVGQAAGQLPQGRRDLDRRQLRSRPEPDLLGHRAGQAVDAREPRQHGVRRGAVCGVNRRAERRRRQAGVALPACARRVARPRRGLRARARGCVGAEDSCSTIGKAGILWKLDRTNGKFLGYKETVYQNVFDRIDPKTGVPTYRADIIEQQVEQWIQSCPSTEGGHNWQAMSYHQPTNALIIPLSQSCMEMSGREDRVPRRRRRHRR